MQRKLKVAIVIPAYNEEEMISSVIFELHKAFEGQSFDYQIVVVDDGSRDATAFKAKTAGVYVIKHILNTGSGGATATGLSYAWQNDFDIATTSDADGQHDPKDVLKGIEILINDGTDLLIGSRMLKKEGMPRSKTFGNQGLSSITYMLFGIKVTDSQSGLRIFSKRALSSLKSEN